MELPGREHQVGLWVFMPQFRRAGFVALDELWEALEDHVTGDQRQAVAPREFCLCCVLLPLLPIGFRAEASPTVGKDCFERSYTYLHVTADKVLDVTVTFFQVPVKVMDKITTLGMRRVGYDTPTVLFFPFMWACVEVVPTACPDGEMIASFRWPLGLVAKVMQWTITQGSTIVLEATDARSAEQLREAIQYAADDHRGLDDRGAGQGHQQH